MNDTTLAEFSPPRNATVVGHPWDWKSKAAEHAPGPAPAESARLQLPRGLMDLTGRRSATAELLEVLGDAANDYS
ncbi:hypothetical protein ACGFWI_38850 [Streptomyces sp. NPDC048434]|uniref:hypothetical protein n=1 Tax=Streptomyces sp. NPDC048434 TaxID=3365549 RepID=UPI003716AE8B